MPFGSEVVFLYTGPFENDFRLLRPCPPHLARPIPFFPPRPQSDMMRVRWALKTKTVCSPRKRQKRESVQQAAPVLENSQVVRQRPRPARMPVRPPLFEKSNSYIARRAGADWWGSHCSTHPTSLPRRIQARSASEGRIQGTLAGASCFNAFAGASGPRPQSDDMCLTCFGRLR